MAAPSLTSEQRKVLATIKQVGRRKGATPMEVKAAVETGLTETNLRNLNYGDGSSIGWRQETKSSYPNANRLDLASSVGRFFDEVKAQRGKYGKAGDLAQAVQRSAYPGRYDQNSAQANALLGGVGAPATTAPSSYGTAPGGTDKRALALSLLGMGGYGGGDPLTLALQQATQQAPKAAPAPTGGSYGSAPTGEAVNGLVPQVVKALAFARAHGWKGQVNSGYRSDAEQLRIWNSGVRPAAKPKALGGSGSNHSSGQAVDVSDVAGFARAMAQAPRSIRLYNRVPNDALHFSVTGH